MRHSINALVQQRSLHGIELLGVLCMAPAIQGDNLVGKMIDLQLLALELFIAAGQLHFLVLQSFDESRAQFLQLICVHLSQFAWQLHGLGGAIDAT